MILFADCCLYSGNALTDNFLQDVGITQNWFNVGQQLLNAGIVLLEVRPSSLQDWDI